LPGGKCRSKVLSPAGRGMPGRGRPADKRRLGRRLNHSRPEGQEVLSPAGRGMSDPGGSADKRRRSRSPARGATASGRKCRQRRKTKDEGRGSRAGCAEGAGYRITDYGLRRARAPQRAEDRSWDQDVPTVRAPPPNLKSEERGFFAILSGCPLTPEGSEGRGK
jgi:hypothetical protein